MNHPNDPATHLCSRCGIAYCESCVALEAAKATMPMGMRAGQNLRRNEENRILTIVRFLLEVGVEVVNEPKCPTPNCGGIRLMKVK